MAANKSTWAKRLCKVCGKEFPFPEHRPSWNKPGFGLFCSRSCKYKYFEEPLSVRFMRNVGPLEPNGCKLWQGYRNHKGYGYTCKFKIAARVAWSLVNGPIPEGMHVLHTCDNPPCVNIDHLFLGTPAINSADMKTKGRNRKGERHPIAKLTEETVREMRRRHAAGERYQQLAKEFHVHRQTAKDAITKVTWGHVT